MAGRKSTKYPGVQARESTERKYRGRPDVCYTIDYRDATGQRIRKDVGWASQGFTAALAAEMRARLIHAAKTAEVLGEPAPKPQAPTFAEAFARYRRDWLEPRHSSSKAAESRYAKHLQGLAPMRLDQITALELDRLMAELRAKGLAPQTIRHAIGLVRAVMLRMAKWGLYSGPMPFAAISLPKPNNARVRFLSPEEAQNLLAELRRRSHQTWLMALVSLHCGLRFGEIARLRFGDLDFVNGSIYIADSKNGSARHAVMTSDVAAALAELPRAALTDLVFPDRNGGMMKAASAAFARAVDSLGLNDSGETDASGKPVKIADRRQRVVFHTLRHTYASWLAKSGQSQFVIADRLGHRSLAMTQRYTHLMDESRRESADAISRMFHGKPRQS